MDKLDEENLEVLFDVLDKAITSDNPAVQSALKELMLTVALTTGQNREKTVDGPLKRLLLMVQHMDGRISAMEREKWKKPEVNWDQAKKWKAPPLLDNQEN